MKILVTGAAGFIGFHLSQNLVEKGFDVVGLDNINDYYSVDLKYARLQELGISKESIVHNKIIAPTNSTSFRFIKLDLQDKEQLNTLFEDEQFNIVINLAAQAGVRYSIDNPDAYIDSNVHGFINILEVCRNFSIKHLLYASSSSVYGNTDKTPFSETDQVDKPVSLYAATKKANELMAHTYSHLFDIPTTGLRFFTVYGPWGRPDMAYYKFAEAIVANKSIDVYNNGNLRRDFTYIDDIVNGIVNLIPQYDGDKYKLYNIGNNKPVKLMEFINTLETLLETKAQCNYLPMQAGDVYETYADISRIKAACSFSPEVSLKDGLSHFVDWFKEYRFR